MSAIITGWLSSIYCCPVPGSIHCYGVETSWGIGIFPPHEFEYKWLDTMFEACITHAP